MPSLYENLRRRITLHRAWEKVHSAGLRSESAQTQEAVRQFAKNVLRHIEKAQRDLRHNRYAFSPARGVPVEREGKGPRPIVVQDVRDRVVQRALLDVVMSNPPVVETVDCGTSFGAIPGKSVADALRMVAHQVSEGPARYYIRSDIKNFFGRMPREDALAMLTPLLADSSLNEFLDRATETELANQVELGHLIGLFPDQFTGLPQGHALSALLGNLLLGELDAAVNTDRAAGLRYLDDFIILAPDRKVAWTVFRRARAVLNRRGLSCYAPGESGKAAEGSTQRMFEFLGCEMSPTFVRPSRTSRRRLLSNVRELLNESANTMKRGGFATPTSYHRSVITTLRAISLILQGWSEQYSFCNYGQIQRQMDNEIDNSIREYLGRYADKRKRAQDDERRRMLGVWRIQDAQQEPIFARAGQFSDITETESA